MGTTATPAADGFWMPAEFEKHDGCWMLWPERVDNWRDGARPVQQAFALLAAAIARFEPLTVGVSRRQAAFAREALLPQVKLVTLASDDAWMRDVGPTFLVNRRGALRGVDWRFNAWGDKFVPYDDDALAARRFADAAGDPVRSVDMVFEGGSITGDGEGTVVTTTQCLMHPNRNPTMTKTQIEAVLRAELGTERLLWLPHGLALDDDTDGHVDNVAAFAAPGQLVLQGCDDTDEDDWLRLDIDRRVAIGAIDARGRELDVTVIPVLPFAEVDGERVVVPYLNYYVGNGSVVVPTCGHPADDDMVAMIGDLYPGRDTFAVEVGATLAYGGGGIHCITQQIPAP